LSEGPNWRPLTTLALAAVILVAGAAVAAAAALDKHNTTKHSVVVALVPSTPTAPSATTPPTATTPGLPTTPGASSTPGTGAGTSTVPHSASKGSANNLLFPPTSATKPPKIPVPAATPKSTGGSSGTPGEATNSPGGATTTTPATTKTNETSSTAEPGAGKGEQPTPILLDTDAASTYNPSGYPESGFGDAALAIDGEPSTAWTAQIQPSSFPKMAEGLLIDLRSSTKLGSVELRTPTRGTTIQMYGANGSKAPAAITTSGWSQISSTHVLKKTVTHLKLHPEGQAFRWVLVWIVKAPPAAQGTAQTPGHVALSEVALYPPSSS
jgi:hypothetical protein